MRRIIQIFTYLFVVTATAQISNVNTLLSNSNQLHLNYNSGELVFEITSDGENTYTQLIVDGLTKSYAIGNPDLPVFSKLIEVPQTGGVSIDVLNFNEHIVDLTSQGFHYEIQPSQASVFKNQDPAKIVLEYNEELYSTDEFYSPELITIERLGRMRGKSIARLEIAPFAYNPITNELKVKKDLEFTLNFENEIQPISNALKSQDFEANFSKLINNNSATKHNFSSHTTRMIILSDPQFEETLQPFIDWKTRKGIEVIEAYKGTDLVGSTFESMKTFIQSYYDNATEASPAPTYLLIVGDHEQIPSFDAGAHVSDMYYCEFDGNGDYFPEMIFGRFSATTDSELTIQIDKTLQYEQYTMSDPSYLGEVLLVAGVDGNFAPTHGNGQINYGSDNYFNEEHNLDSYVYLYPETNSSDVEEAIIEHVSNGVGFSNYTAHCGPSGWSDPSFEVNDISGLENEDQYGLMVGNCCQSNTFNGVTCFGEALLRQSKGGAVGYIGGSNNTLWDEDYYWSVGNGPISANPTYEETGLAIYDCSFHENNEQTDDWSITQGQLLQSGNWAVTESGSGNTQYYWEIYHLMGDPSVLTYYGVPSQLSVSHPEALAIGMSSVTVSTEQYTYVAISQNGVLLDAKYSDESGNVTLTFDPLSSMDALEVVASKQNKQVFIGVINMMSSDAAYVGCSSIEVNDGIEGNGEVEFNETFQLDMNIQNYGSVDASDVSVMVSCANPNVSITQEVITEDTVFAESTLVLNDLVTVALNGNFSDQEMVVLEFVIVDAEGTEWITTNSFVVNAPSLEFSSSYLSNDNATISLGETVDVIFVLDNVGHANCDSGVVSISSDFASLIIDIDEIPFSSIVSNGQYTLTVPVTLDADAPLGVPYLISLNAVSFDSFSTDYSLGFVSPNCSIESTEVTINVATDYYSNETSWILTDAFGELINEVTTGSLDSEHSYTDIYCMTPNTYYTFMISDSYGDGMFSEGYSIVICGETIAAGSDFGDGETINFISGCDQSLEVGCTDPEATNYNEDAVVDDGSCFIIGIDELVNNIRLYPNPAINSFVIESNGLFIKSFSLIQMDGKEVKYVEVSDAKTAIGTSDLDPGYYILKLNLENGASITKPVVVM